MNKKLILLLIVVIALGWLWFDIVMKFLTMSMPFAGFNQAFSVIISTVGFALSVFLLNKFRILKIA